MWDKKWESESSGLSQASYLDRCSQRCFDILKRWVGVGSGLILETGAGSGRFCLSLAKENTAAQIIGVDLSPVSLNLIKNRAKKDDIGNVTVVRADIQKLPFAGNCFDVVFNEGVVEHFRDPESLLLEMKRVLKPGGRLIVAVPNRFNFIYGLTLFFSRKERVKYGYIKLFSPGALKALFKKCGFIDIKISGFDPAHSITRLSQYWPRCELLARVIDKVIVKPLDFITHNRFSFLFGLEIIACGVKDGSDKGERISQAYACRGGSKQDYADFQFLFAAAEVDFYKQFTDFKGKKILDIGCGLGGKAAAYAKEAGKIFALDCKLNDLIFAKRFSTANDSKAVFFQADAGKLPLKNHSFDVIILNDIIEHLPRPAEVLKECKRILKKGGVVFVNFPPFYGPYGGHLGYYFSFPWVHFLPKKLIRYLLLRKKTKAGWLTPEVVQDTYNSVRRLTIRQFRKLVNDSGFGIRYQDFMLYSPNLPKKLIHFPFLKEVVTKNIRCVLEKRGTRVAIISRSYLYGPHHKKLEELSKFKDIEITLITPQYWKHSLGDIALEKESAQAYKIKPLSLAFNGNYFLYFYRSLGKILSDLRPDVVHIEDEPGYLSTFLIARFCRRNFPQTKVLVFTWENIYKRFKFPFSYFENYALRNVDSAVAGNKEAKNILVEKGFKRAVSVVPLLGVDPAEFTPKKPARLKKELGLKYFVAGYIGRLVAAKGLSTLVKAVAGINSELQLLLVGCGDYRRRLEEEIERLGIKERVTILDSVGHREVPEYLNCLDVLVLPSETAADWKEQFGHILIEAMACEIPVIGSDSGEIPNVVGEGGLIFKESDYQDLRDKLKLLIKSPRLKSQLGRAGRKRVLDNYTHQRVAAEYYRIYQSLKS